MNSPEMVVLSLTGPQSHVLEMEPGVGSLAIGPRIAGSPVPGVVVDPDQRINWSEFDRLTTPSGAPWPRVLRYQGNDRGLFAWSRTRPIESLQWQPTVACTVDASASQIGNLALVLRSVPLDITLPRHTNLSVIGNLECLTPRIAQGGSIPRLHFAPEMQRRTEVVLQIPRFEAFADAETVSVSTAPLHQVFDCASLLQFTGLRTAILSGQPSSLEILRTLPSLSALELRNCPDLSELPSLETWPELVRFIAWNFDEVTGKRLRGELARIKKSGRSWEYCSLTKLRGREWFVNEYGLPFSGWTEQSARLATKAYRVAQASIATTEKSIRDVEVALRRFVQALNKLPGMETAEREDAGVAVAQLVGGSAIPVTVEQGMAWFDQERDF